MADIIVNIKQFELSLLDLKYNITQDDIINLLVKNGLKNTYDYFERCDKITVWPSTRKKINENKSNIKDKLFDLMKYVVTYYIKNFKNVEKHPDYLEFDEYTDKYKKIIKLTNFYNTKFIEGYQDDFKDDINNNFKPELTNKIAEINNLIDELKTLCKVSTESQSGGKKSRKQRRRQQKSRKHRKSRRGFRR